MASHPPILLEGSGNPVVWDVPMYQEKTVYFTEEQAAERLHISLSTLRRWRKKGTGPEHFHFGDIIRYRDTALEAFVAKYSTNAA